MLPKPSVLCHPEASQKAALASRWLMQGRCGDQLPLCHRHRYLQIWSSYRLLFQAHWTMNDLSLGPWRWCVRWRIELECISFDTLERWDFLCFLLRATVFSRILSLQVLFWARGRVSLLSAPTSLKWFVRVTLQWLHHCNGRGWPSAPPSSSFYDVLCGSTSFCLPFLAGCSSDLCWARSSLSSHSRVLRWPRTSLSPCWLSSPGLQKTSLCW